MNTENISNDADNNNNNNESGKYIISWDSYQEKCAVLVEEIKKSDWKPDSIVALVRGGFYAADYVSRKLNLPMSSMLTRSYDVGAGEQSAGKVEIAPHILTFKELGKNILIVDDLVDRGDTMHAVMAHLKALYPESDIKTAVLIQKPHSTFTPDFVAEKMTEQKWIVQPFEVEE